MILVLTRKNICSIIYLSLLLRELIGGVLLSTKTVEKQKEDYRQKIIEMVKKIEKCDILIYIYKLVFDIVKEDDK